MLTVEHNNQTIPEGKKASELSLDIKRPFLKDLWRVLTRQHIHIKMQIWTPEKLIQGDVRIGVYTVLPEPITKIIKKLKLWQK